MKMLHNKYRSQMKYIFRLNGFYYTESFLQASTYKHIKLHFYRNFKYIGKNTLYCNCFWFKKK